ncbi:phosphoribosyltransferase family protein [Actinoplanes sp. CA-142083]|uniref:phosphoribosyltransferase family protein n=1 Tax=Actinoplanes sp. CA-142083 TaxID=3239903 RepID=UPI003D8D2BBD
MVRDASPIVFADRDEAGRLLGHEVARRLGHDPSPAPGHDPLPAPGRGHSPSPGHDPSPARGYDPLPAPGRDHSPARGHDSLRAPGHDRSPSSVPDTSPSSVPDTSPSSVPDTSPALVLALPRGGVPVAVRVAARIGGDLDIVLARKIGAPGRPEFGVGAIAEDGPPVFDEGSLAFLGITEDDLADTVTKERAELARRVRRYREGRPAPAATGRTVILVDDGLATGVTARAALRWLHDQSPRRTILAAPVCAPQAAESLAADADTVICLSVPPSFRAVGQWYDDFHQLTDEDVALAMSGFAHT